MPMQLNGERRVDCGCRRTPPVGDVPVNVCVCVQCGGHGSGRFGCWGTPDKPHEHCYAIPVHELASMYRVMAGLARQHARVRELLPDPIEIPKPLDV